MCRVSLTDEGVIFLQGCRRVLEDIGEVERSVTSGKSPVGILRISASVLFGQDPIVPLLPEFMARFPKLEVQLSLADRDFAHVGAPRSPIDPRPPLEAVPCRGRSAAKAAQIRPDAAIYLATVIDVRLGSFSAASRQ
jgi:DNA-binding transcriptional LysR family regulator